MRTLHYVANAICKILKLVTERSMNVVTDSTHWRVTHYLFLHWGIMMYLPCFRQIRFTRSHSI